MLKKKLISFDLDQTLVNTIQSHMGAYIEVFKKNNLKLPSKERLRPLLDGRHGNDVLNALYPHLSKKMKDKIREDRKIILKKYAPLMKPIPGIKKALNILKKDYSLILVTNAERNEVELFLKKSKINPKIFDLIVLARKHPKPMPDGIIKAEHLFHVKSDIHVGDSVYDVLAAKNAKAVSVAVLTGQATRKKLEKYHPDYILKSVAELPKLLKDKKFD
jgi:HAD superfamily hydrolase (TIGR01549 family)